MANTQTPQSPPQGTAPTTTTTPNGGSSALAKAGELPPVGAMVLGSDAFKLSLEPTSLEDAFKIAGMAASMKLCGVESAEDALIRIMTGRGLGLTTMQSFRGVYVVHGRPSLDASLMHAICINSPLCDFFDMVSSDEKQATYKTKRRGKTEVEWQFTIEDAAKQGLIKEGSNWLKVPKDMLRARCKSTLARMEYPDLLFGLYTREEIESGAITLEETRNTAGETVYTKPPEAPSPVQGVKRDFKAEADALIARIKVAKTTEERAAVRKDVQSWDGVEPFLSQVKDAYNGTRETKGPKGPQPAPAAAQTELPGAVAPTTDPASK